MKEDSDILKKIFISMLNGLSDLNFMTLYCLFLYLSSSFKTAGNILVCLLRYKPLLPASIIFFPPSNAFKLKAVSLCVLFVWLTISILEDDAHHVSLSTGVPVHQPEWLHLGVHKPALICTARPNTRSVNTTPSQQNH